MTWKLIKNTAKWLWILAILLFASYYAANKHALINQMLKTLSAGILLSAFILIFFAKLCLVANMRLAAKRFAIFFSWLDSFRIYNVTQMGKYVPGAIWQFVGRIGILHERGVSALAIRDSLLAEQLWVFSSASLLATILIFANKPEFFVSWLANLGFNPNWIYLFSALFLVTILAFLSVSRTLHRWAWQLVPPLSAVPVLLLTWLFLGSSLWVTLIPYTESFPSLLYVTGIYCFAYVAGFVVPFAPAGIGIREAILVFALLPFVGRDEAILLAAVNRVIYFLVEVMASALCLKMKAI